jgi:hypothetical protein
MRPDARRAQRTVWRPDLSGGDDEAQAISIYVEFHSQDLAGRLDGIFAPQFQQREFVRKLWAGSDYACRAVIRLMTLSGH